MTEGPNLEQEAIARRAAPFGDGLWESLEIYIPELGVPRRHGPGNVAVVPIKANGSKVTEPGDADRYHDRTWESRIGHRVQRILWRDANDTELAQLIAKEDAEEAILQEFEARQEIWNGIKQQFLDRGKVFKNTRWVHGEKIFHTMDRASGDYRVVFNEDRWMWWIQEELVPDEDSPEDEDKLSVWRAYRLRWNRKLAHQIRTTPPMPDYIYTF